mmetsp:Transcript_14674/g.37113  ORF Transcript_14674/g.37113 Transcript_14674/m.37113 type:complete len:291 (-) Transcript_14674:184-1056(-)
MLISLVYTLARKVYALEKKPPVTLALLAVNIVAFYNIPDGIAHVLPRDTCLKPEPWAWAAPGWGAGPSEWAWAWASSLLSIFSLERIVWSAFLHGNDLHIYHNMLSLVSKGIKIEREYGSAVFAFMTVFILLAAHSMYVLVAHVLSTVAGVETGCAIGFSAVLFGYKSALTFFADDGTYSGRSFFGIFDMPLKYVTWLELVTIQLTTERASFLGHACGIVAGYLYAWVFMNDRALNLQAVRQWARNRKKKKANRTFQGHGKAMGSNPNPDPNANVNVNETVRTERLKKFQ